MARTSFKFKSLFDLQQTFNTEKKCIRFLEKKLWANGVVSPFDPSSKVYRRSDGTYRCKNTGKNFNVRTGTIFENSKAPLRKWFMAIYMLTSHKKGITSVQVAKDIDVTQKTAWYMMHKIRNAFVYNGGKLSGEIELDETFVGGKNKNRHGKGKIRNARGRSHLDKEPVFGMLQRDPNGGGLKVICFQVDNTSWKPLTRHIITNVRRDVTLYMDDWQGYSVVKKVYKHHVVDHGHGIYAVGGAYTNTIEAFWSNYCKRAISGTYNYISRHHLQRYFDEFSFHYNTRKVKDNERFEMFFGNIGHPMTNEQIKQGNGRKRKVTLKQIAARQRAQRAAA